MAPQVLQEPLDVDTIQRELPHELDQVHLEALQLQKQVAELEKHLGSARKESGGAAGRQQPKASDTAAVGGEVGAPWCSASCAGLVWGAVLASGEPSSPSLFFPGWAGFVWAVLCRRCKGLPPCPCPAGH